MTTSCAVGEVAIVNDLIAKRGLTILGARAFMDYYGSTACEFYEAIRAALFTKLG